MNYQLNMREVTYALSEGLDFVGIDDILHGKRVAYISAEIAKVMGWDQESIDTLMTLGMLHDCGVSSTVVHTHLVNELDWNDSEVHAIIGERLLQETTIYKDLAPYVRYHHTHWDLLPDTLSQKVKDFANLIYLSDRVDALRAQMSSLGVKTLFAIEEAVKKYSGTMFSPELVDAFLKLASRGSFWFYLESEALERYLNEWVQKAKIQTLRFEEIKEIAVMFGNIVDAKSQFTAEHSIGVSRLSRHLAELFNLSEDDCEQVELAGLLHDLGKLRIKDEILNKPRALNADEKLYMNRHSFDSDIILRKISGFKQVAHIASLHHEKLNGTGYPYCLYGDNIPFTARIIAVADIFQALIQTRPYREGMTEEAAYEIIYKVGQQHQLDQSIIEKLKEYLPECYEYANAKPNAISYT